MSARARWQLNPAYAVLVTGSTKGIGLATAEEFVALGASVIVNGRDAAEVDKTVEHLQQQNSGANVWGFPADLSSKEDRAKLLKAISTRCDGKLSCLVNNAGTNVRKSVIQATEEEYEKITAINMHAVYNLCKEAFPLLKADGNASVINVSSVAGVASTGSGAIYAMTKAAVVQLTKSLACEWAQYGIRVNCVAPWVTSTPLFKNAIKGKPDSLNKIAEWTPLKRPAEPEEQAAAVAFFALPASQYITGQILNVDGGLSANMFHGPCCDPE